MDEEERDHWKRGVLLFGYFGFAFTVFGLYEALQGKALGIIHGLVFIPLGVLATVIAYRLWVHSK